MATLANSFWRDANRVPYTNEGFISVTSSSLTASNTTASNILFRLTGSVQVLALYGVVTTVLSSNITAAHYRLNDQTAQPAISAAGGTTLSSAAVGSVIMRKALAATALTFIDSAAARISESSAVNLQYASPFVLTQKTGGIQTDIEFTYTTTNTPATGVIQFFLKWLPVSADAAITSF